MPNRIFRRLQSNLAERVARPDRGRLLGLACSLLLLAPMIHALAENPPHGLMVDLLTKPEESVITHSVPKFSWVVNDPRPGAVQTAYQIIVTAAGPGVDEEAPPVWNSGKVGSAQSIGILFSGTSLQPQSAYQWKVRTWNEKDQASPYSDPQRFFTGDLEVSGSKPGKTQWVESPDIRREEPVLADRHTIGYEEIAPVSVTRNEAGNHFITFERAAFATLKLRTEVETAVSVIVHLGEKASAAGDQVDRLPGGSITYKRAELRLEPGQTDHVVALPRQVSHYPNSQILAERMPEVAAFRFVEIENVPGELTVENVRQLALLYPFDDDASAFRSSNENLNRVWDLCKHTLKVTPFMGLYVDGARERMPYEADAYIQQISHYCVDREYAIGRSTLEFLVFDPSWPTEWQLHVVLMAWADYMQTGDPRFLARYYDELKAKTLLALAREDGLISTRTGLVTDDFLANIHYTGKSFRDIVDWPQGTPATEDKNRSGHGSESIAGETDRFVFSPINSVVNAFHYRNLILMREIARVLEDEADAAWFEERASKVARSFNDVFLDPATGLYTDGEGVDHSSLHANMFPAAFGLAPAEHHAAILNFIRSRGMACSPYGAPYLMDALFALGGAEHALALLSSESDRSWMNMIRIGSTMTAEAWDMRYKKNMTWNHAWGASPAYTITRRVMGIEPLEPAFRTIRVQPHPGGLTHAEIRTPTIRGPVTARFRNAPGESFSLEVVIPANTSAEVLLPRPAGDDFELTHNGRQATARVRGNFLLFDQVEAGRHEFSWKE